MWFDGCDDIAHAAHDCRKVDTGRAHINAKARCVDNRMCDLRAFNERLGWNASGIQAIAAHFMRFY